MAIVPNTITLPENRLDLEALIEAAIARLDDVDGDTDLEAVSEDEGAQCEDEGSYNCASGHPFGTGDFSPIRLVRS